MTNISADHVKVHFRIDVDEDGWPPASVESLWAVDLGDGTVRLDNTPWFVRGVACEDVIRVEADAEGWGDGPGVGELHDPIDRAEGQRFSSCPTERAGGLPPARHDR